MLAVAEYIFFSEVGCDRCFAHCFYEDTSLEKLIASPSSLYKQTVELLKRQLNHKGTNPVGANLVNSVVSGPNEVEYYKLFYFFPSINSKAFNYMTTVAKTVDYQNANILVSF